MVKIVTVGGHLLGFAYHESGGVVEANVTGEASDEIPNLRRGSDGPEDLHKPAFLACIKK